MTWPGQSLIRSNSGPSDQRQGELQEDENGQASATASRKVMHLSEVWDFLEDARKHGVSVPKLAAIKGRDLNAGVKGGSVHYWQRKALNMYHLKTKMGFPGLNHIHLVTDGSTHGNQEVLVTLFVNKRSEQAFMGTCQRMKQSKIAAPNEYNVDVEIERILARREGERMSAYKMLQALSRQLELVSRMPVSSFRLPVEDMICLLPHTRETARWVEDGVLHFQPQNHADDDITVDVCALAASAPVLVILMDQSTTNTSLMAFLQARNWMIHPVFDKIHRCIRDLKLAEDASSGKCLTKSHLASSYLFGVNFKPFGAGTFGEEKKDILQQWFESETQVPWMEIIFVLAFLFI